MSSFAQRRSSGRSASGLSMRTPQPGRTSSLHSRRSSQNSNGISPVTSHLDVGLADLASGGLGTSLADELDQNWDEAEAEEYGEAYDDTPNTIAVETPITPGSPLKSHLQSSQHGRTDSAYDGSDYGDDNDLLPVKGFSPFLEKGMADVEALARIHTDVNDGIWERAIHQLRDLPPQMDLENASSRLVTANTAAAVHLENTSRIWPQMTHAIMTPWATAVPLDILDMEGIEELVADLVKLLPQPPIISLENLHHLNSQTSDVLSSLSNITDQLQMQNQASAKAAQHLKAVKDVVGALRHEYDLSEEGIEWLENENWNERIREREAAKVCRDVVGGFEEVCNSWRNKLIEQSGETLGTVDAAAA